jgi:hypothetical protein
MTRNNKKHKLSSSTLLTERELAQITTAPQAFAAVRAEIEAIPADQLAHLNVEVSRATRCGLVTARNVQALLPELAEVHPFDVRPVRMLRIYSLALSHAHSLAIEGDGEVPPLPILVAEATPLRERMLRTAELLVLYGIVSEQRVAAIRRGHGYVDLIDDLLALARMLEELWPRVRDSVMTTREELERAVSLSAQLQTALALQEARQTPLTPPEGRRFVRSQAFTLFYRAYQQARRGVVFLRWDEGDAHLFVPSLFTRKPRRASVDEDAADDLLDPSTVTDDEPAPEPVPPSVTAADELVASV